MADKVYYDSIEALGEKVLSQNPTWKEKGLSARDAGDFYLDKYPHEVGIGPDPEANQEWTAGRVVDEMVGPDSPWGALSQGLASGLTLGYSKDALPKLGIPPTQLGDSYVNDMMYGYGELTGEVLPYILARGMLNPAAAAAIKASPALGAIAGAGANASRGTRFLKQLGYAGQAGVESAMVEMGKETRAENPDFLGTAAVALTLGAGGEGAVRAGVSGYKGAKEWILGPGKEEAIAIGKRLQEFYTKYGITAVTPGELRQDPISDLVSHRLMKSQVSADDVMDTRLTMAQQTNAAGKRILSEAGPNAAIASPLKASDTIKKVVDETEEALHQKGSDLYTELVTTEVGQVPIHLEVPVIRHGRGGEKIASSIRESIRHFEKETENLGLPGMAALRPIISKMRRAYTIPNSPGQVRAMAKERVEERLMREPRSVVPEAEWDFLRDQAIEREADRLANDPEAMRLFAVLDEGPPGFFNPKDPVELGPPATRSLPSGKQIGEGGFEEEYAREAQVAAREASMRANPVLIREQAEKRVDNLLSSNPYSVIPEEDLNPYIDASTEAELVNVNEWLTSKLEPPTYQWWWDRLQELGIAGKATRSLPGASRANELAGQAYHTFQDMIDGQAKGLHPEYEPGIKRARARWEAYRAYQENSLVQDILKNEDSANLMTGVVFKNVESVIQAKRVLGAEGYDAARQVWLRDLSDGMIKTERLPGPEAREFSYVSSEKMKKELDDKASTQEFLDEVFSDTGFIDEAGEEVTRPDLLGSQRREKFEDLYQLASRLDESLDRLKIRLSNLAGSSYEQVGPGAFAVDFFRGGQRSKSILADLLMMTSAKEEYFKPFASNILLGARIPGMESSRSYLQAGGRVDPFSVSPSGGTTSIPGATRSTATSAVLNRLGLGGNQ